MNTIRTIMHIEATKGRRAEMKRLRHRAAFAGLLLLGLAACTGQNGQSQVKNAKPDEPKTKIEAFQAQTGVVIIRGFSDVGSLKGQYGTSVTIQSRELTDASTGKKESGIAIIVKGGGGLEREDTSYVDYDEIEGLLKGLRYVGKVDKGVTKLDNFEADFRTKGDLEISTYSLGREGGIGLGVSSGVIGKSQAFLNLDKLSDLVELIEKAKGTLDAAR